MSGPVYLVVLGLEAPPLVVNACRNESEQIRLDEWLAARGYDELIEQACRLEREERAA